MPTHPNRAVTRATEDDAAGLENGTPTQPTQGTYDPRRSDTPGPTPSDVNLADVLCILHPCSPAAFSIVESTARTLPQHVLQNVAEVYNDGLSQAEVEEVETFILNGRNRPQPLDLALRFSSRRMDPARGFVFGRNRSRCDIVIGTDTVKRVSNTHFRIFVNSNGVCMLEDLSTNGTVVDTIILKGKGNPQSATRMLNAGSIVEILSPKTDEVVKFILRIPSRESHMEEFNARLYSFMQDTALAEAAKGHQLAQEGGIKAAYPRLAATGNLPMVRPSMIQNTWGMKWNGGDHYNVVGHLGKGAFATVYRLATKRDGQLFAAKELEKRRFMKNGILDRKLDNELQIMRTIDHPHVVRYVDYRDVEKHLYIIMEYVPCGDLQQWLQANGALPEDLANIVAEQVLSALTYLHKKRITHRDIKPDNILIANDSDDSFSIKLSDFGLSKVVKDNDTFLKTFCGTLLYCAPEVFPHYDNFLAAHGKSGSKRKERRGGTPQRPKYHMYSQSVDIWSLGGVLWYAMCLRPPFEGVADATGRGMFDKIMTTRLDPTLLHEHGISEVAIDLLEQMLDTDPAERPTPEKCLLHPWFERSGSLIDSPTSEMGLGTINEEDEADAGATPDFSQLSLRDGGKEGSDHKAEFSFSSSDLEYLDPRQSKRVKHAPRLHQKAATQPPTSTPAYHFKDQLLFPPITGALVSTSQGELDRPLFGEIEPSPLKSSGVFGMRGTQFMPRLDAPSAGSSAYATSSMVAHEQLFASAASRYNQALGEDYQQGRPMSRGLPATPSSSSLEGVEPDMRDLKMDSPGGSAGSPTADINEPQTPKTPETPPQASLGQAGSATEETPKPAELTPKEPRYSRQITLPVTASFFYDPNDPSTHNPEYASSISGYDFTTNNVMPAESFHSLPSTRHSSVGSLSSSEASEIEAPPQSIGRVFVRPAPRLGRLSSTPDSFVDYSMDLSSRVTSWGRALGNTFVFPDPVDTRVPKVGFILYFHAKGIEQAERLGDDWTKLPGLHCLLATEGKYGIGVNGHRLLPKDKDGRKLCGRVYTGDIITICSGKSLLQFQCTFFHGEGKDTRPESASRFHVSKAQASTSR